MQGRKTEHTGLDMLNHYKYRLYSSDDFNMYLYRMKHETYTKKEQLQISGDQPTQAH
jgi:hypothetical protein